MSQTVAPSPIPLDIAILAALPIEINTFSRMLRKTRSYRSAAIRLIEGELGGRIVGVAITGVGRERARRAAESLLLGHRPRWLISAGFAGALSPALRLGDVLLPHTVLEPNGVGLTIEFELASNPGIAKGTLATVDQIVTTARGKAELRDATRADAVDMETSAVASVAAERRIRFLAVRSISDDADQDLPPEVLSIMGPTGGYRLGAAVGAIMREPRRLGPMLKLRDQADTSAKQLARVLSWLIPQLS